MKNPLFAGLLLWVISVNVSAVSPLDSLQLTNLQLPNSALRSVTYAAGRYVAVGDNGTVLVSTNAERWVVAWPERGLDSPGLLLAMGSLWPSGLVGPCCIRPPAPTGSLIGCPPGYPLTAVAFNEGTFVAVGSSGVVFRSTNGVDWAQEPSGVPFQSQRHYDRKWSVCGGGRYERGWARTDKSGRRTRSER